MTTTIGAPASGKAGRRGSHAVRWWVLVVLGVAQLMVTLDATVVNIALPAAQQDLGFSDGDRQWVITGYALAFGSLLLLGGRLGDLFGRRNTFAIGLIGFAGASVVGGAASSFEILVAARVGQGVFGALLAPAALSLLTVTFTEKSERAKAFGIFSALSGAGAAIGLLLGGMLTEWASWRWVMFVNVGFAAIALVGAVLLLAKHVDTERPKLDIPGTVVVSAALFAVVYGFAHAESTGWTNPVTLGFLIGGVVLLTVFVWLEARVAHPLLPLRLVLDRTRGGSFMAVFVMGMGMFSIFLFLTFYLIVSLGYSPIKGGLAFLPMVAGIVLASTTVPSLLLPRVGPKIVISSSFLVSATGMAWLTQLELGSRFVTDVLPGLVLLGIGLGGAMTTAFQGATAGVHHEDAGVASALINTSQQVGGSISTALLTTVAASAMTEYLTSHQPGPLTVAQAHVASYTATFTWGTGIFVVGAVIAALVVPNAALAPSEGELVIAH
ncbi:MFS transporter [Rhodococcus opacus]|uniref:MFS transporter n=1 Tax=Rhodococcus opacus TaxID=37919 RepID=A0AAX3YNE2_RHOOP|nr:MULTISPECIES: MFS transporter [Rhodococcus]NHU41797.1 MFS transporter [Rhodococcus sp. A14]MCZ4586354.1 MFS transporter [Rhodococcus opacus]MDI9940509.1 MFS transporter [Rhodococcus sp. IEGM 1351]UZG59462.1 MFS transporter [Rhodococcus opacus]WKN59287.1 MFS transporter [Rhodococcus opacus]